VPRPDVAARHALEARCDDSREHVKVDRLGHIVVGAEPPALELVVMVRESGQKHKRHARKSRLQRREALEQIKAGHHWHIDIRQHQIWRSPNNGIQAVARVVRDADVVAPIAQFFGNQRRGLTIILDAENSRAGCFHGSVVCAVRGVVAPISQPNRRYHLAC